MAEERFNEPGYSQEDSYFHQRDRELLAKKRAMLDAERTASASMQCPRCASAMTEVGVDYVKIDRCTGCGGVFLDKGELEVLTHAQSGGLFKRLFGSK